MKARFRKLVWFTVLMTFMLACRFGSLDRSESPKDTPLETTTTGVSDTGEETITCLSNIPIYPGSQAENEMQAEFEDLVHTMKTMSQTSGGEVSVYITADTPGNVVKFYQQNPPQDGWEKTIDLTSPEEGGIIVWEKGDFSAQIFVAVKEQNTVVLLGCGPKPSSLTAPSMLTFTKDDGLADDTITAIGFTTDGTAWVATDSGISRYDGQTWTTYTPENGLPGNWVTDVAVRVDNAVWVSIESLSYQGIARFNGSAWETFDNVNKANSISIAPDGSPWVSVCDIHDGGVYHFVDQGWTRYSKDDVLDHCVQDIAISSEGVIWATTNSSVAKFDGGVWETYTADDGLAGEANAISIDQDGIVWIGTDAGVSRYNGQAWTTYTPDDGLIGQKVTDVAVAPDGSVWFGTNSGVSRLKGTTWQSYTEQDGLPSNKVISISAAPDGRIWVGTLSDGVAVLEPSEVPSTEGILEEPTNTPESTNLSNEGENSNPVTIELDSVAWAAYQTGNGPWTAVDAAQLETGTVVIPIDSDGRYSVAYVCRNQFKGDEDIVHIYHYVAHKVSASIASCDDQGDYTVTGSITGWDTQNPVSVFLGGDSATVDGQNYSFESVQQSTYDLAALEMENASVPVGFYIKRDIAVEGNLTTSIDMNNSHNMETYNLEFPGGYGGGVTLHTENGTTVTGFADWGNNRWYKPKAGLLNNDVFKFYGFRQEKGPGNPEVQMANVIEYRAVNSANNYSYDLTTIPLLRVDTNESLPMRFSRLDYQDPDLVAYLINISQTDLTTWLISIPTEWLSEATSYQQPNFAGLERWQDDWNQTSGEMTFWYIGALMPNMVPSDVPQDGLSIKSVTHQSVFTAP